jgi:transcriptional regulator with PAS, ATPase and Fis domain
VDVRVLVATNKNIEEGVKGGRFREDLYYRLNVVNITIPPLRERKEEIPIFVEYFLDKFSKKYQKKIKPLSDKMIKVFSQYHWLGNVRELENVIQRFIILGNEKAIIEELAPAAEKDTILGKKKETFPTQESCPSLRDINKKAIKKAESETILKALEMTNWNRKKAAHILNISYKALLYKIKDTGLDRRFIQQEP